MFGLQWSAGSDRLVHILFAKESILLQSLPNTWHVKGSSVRKGAQYNQFVEKLLISSLQTSCLNR